MVEETVNQRRYAGAIAGMLYVWKLIIKSIKLKFIEKLNSKENILELNYAEIGDTFNKYNRKEVESTQSQIYSIWTNDKKVIYAKILWNK